MPEREFILKGIAKEREEMFKLYENLIYAVRPELVAREQEVKGHESTIFLEEVAKDTGVQLTEEDLEESYDEVDLIE